MMIDLPTESPPAYEQVLTQRLLQCGLRADGFTVQYQRELQSIEIVIEQDAGASASHFDCIRQAIGHDIVRFEDPKLQQEYDRQLADALRPQMLAEARAELEKRGAFEGFPERSGFASDKLFAEALERQCGVKPGSFFVESQWGLIGQPQMGRRSEADAAKLSCLMAAITYVSAKGEGFKFGFIGNEAFAPEK